MKQEQSECVTLCYWVRAKKNNKRSKRTNQEGKMIMWLSVHVFVCVLLRK